MLISLSIENYALISHLEFQPGQGLTVITGETGAGKSIIMGALGLILGQRADAKAVRTGAVKCVIEAAFDISAYGLEDYFHQNDLEYDAHSTIIRREIYATGKSRAFVNDIPVQLQMLRELGSHLIDIHSQHQNLLLGQDAFQLSVIDALAHNQYELGQYRSIYKALTQVQRQIRELRDEASRSAQEADYLRYQYEQLDDAQLEEDEQEGLEAELERLNHAEEIKSGLYGIYESLDGSEGGILSELRDMSRRASELRRIYPEISEIAERIESDFIDLKDIAGDVEGQAEDISFDPQRFEQVEERLGLIYSLQKKHGVSTVAELISLRDELQGRMERIDNSDEEIRQLEKQEKELLKSISQCAAALTATRRQAAAQLQEALLQKVSYLGMPNLRFEASISPAGSTPQSSYTPTGADRIEFLFSANKNQALRPAGEVASGGEISRLMLGIKSLVASARTLPTIIFDEIDTGVSGDIADRMGQVMKELSSHLQVLTITHLPQVAGKGDRHFLVYKADTDADTQTHIQQLSDEQRLHEVARMLSGSNITPEALANARTLIQK